MAGFQCHPLAHSAMSSAAPLILASTSPRRFDLMTEAGLTFLVVPAEVEEFHDEAVPVAELTQQNAALKAGWVAERHPESWVIGADTLVSVEQQALGKPADLEDAARMLRRLSGRTHVVGTAVCLIHAASGRKHEFLEETFVTFRPLDDAGIAHYLTLINPLDKAGSYAAQEHGEVIIEKVDGPYSNVVGLPMERLLTELKAVGALS
jgi:septum formation protein